MKLLLLLIVRIRIFISNKGGDSIDLYCDVVKLTRRKNA